MSTFTFNVYSHGFSVTANGERSRKIIQGFCKGLETYEQVWSPIYRRKVNQVKAVFATGTPDGKGFNFPIQDYDSLILTIEKGGYDSTSWTINNHTPSDGVAIELLTKPGVAPREEQVPIIEFMSAPGKRIRALPLRTGGGKTISTLLTAAKLGRRSGFIMGAQHLVTWLRSVEEFMDVDKKDICVVRGGKALETLIRCSLAGENNYKLIFISQATIRDFIKGYVSTGQTIFGVGPRELYPTLGIGILATDEAHEAIHAVTLHAIYTHVSRVVYLSATLKTDDAFIQAQYDKIFPLPDRFQGSKENDHVDVYPTYYRLNNPRDAKYQGQKGYSHLAYEDWIQDDPDRFENYYKLIKHLLDLTYVNGYKDGQVALIYCAKVVFCDALAERLKRDYGDKRVSSYTASSPNDVLFNTDIIVSTVGSCGTGKDIPNLSTVIATIAIMSIQKNLQMLGRPRPLKNYPGQYPKYLYLNCWDIKKHLDYDKRKRQVFPGKCRSINGYDTNLYV